MADVYAIFGTLIALGIAYPGLLTAWRLLFPELVDRAHQRITHSPWGSFGVGIVAAVPIILLSTIFFSAPGGVAKFIGLLIAAFGFAFASLGAAGLAMSMGVQLNQIAGGKYSIPGAHLRGAVALELAGIFPIIGWLIIFPVSTFICLGAAVRALTTKRVLQAEIATQVTQA